MTWLRMTLIGGAVALAALGLANAPKSLSAIGATGSASVRVTPATLVSALRAARSGDTLLLAPGDYGAVRIAARRFDAPLTIMSANRSMPAVLSKLDIASSANVRVSALTIKLVPDATTVASDSAVRLLSSENIQLTNLTLIGGRAVNGVPPESPAGSLDKTQNVIGLPAARGITILKSRSITLDGNDITSFHKGIVLAGVRDVKISRNRIMDLRTSPLVGSDISNAVIEGNLFSDSHPWQFGGKGDHGDLIHIWTEPKSQSTASDNIVIRSNWLRQGRGQAMLGIYLDDNRNGLGFRNVVIENNLIHNDNHQGIRLENTHARVVNNTLAQPQSGNVKNAPGIIVTDRSVATIARNVLANVSLTEGGSASTEDNLIVQRFSPAKPGHYDRVFRIGTRDATEIDDFTIANGQGAGAVGVSADALRRAMTR